MAYLKNQFKAKTFGPNVAQVSPKSGKSQYD